MRYLIGIVSGLLMMGHSVTCFPSNSGCSDDIELRIVTDKLSYAPGETIHVTLLVRNTGETPLYLFRNIGQCSSQWGWLTVILRDQQNNEIESWPCSTDDLRFGIRDIAATLSNSQSGVFLKKGDIYGREEEFELPKRKGTFLVSAEIAPAAYLTDQQEEALRQARMRILRRTCLAPPVSITVK